MNSYRDEQWSLADNRLKPFDALGPSWNHNTPLRGAFERRMALLEIDVIAAQALGLTLTDLLSVYDVQFPVFRINEDDTWYDKSGKIVFTCSKGLVGVGVDRTTWKRIKGMKEGEEYVHTIDSKKSELYGGQQVTYYAPFTKCDRVEDYKRAWAFFEKRFNNE